MGQLLLGCDEKVAGPIVPLKSGSAFKTPAPVLDVETDSPLIFVTCHSISHS